MSAAPPPPPPPPPPHEQASPDQASPQHDPNFEFCAPKFVDFEALAESEARPSGTDEWFGAPLTPARQGTRVRTARVGKGVAGGVIARARARVSLQCVAVGGAGRAGALARAGAG